MTYTGAELYPKQRTSGPCIVNSENAVSATMDSRYRLVSFCTM